MNDNVLLFCVYTISFEIDVFLTFLKQYFSVNWKDFCSIDTVFMILEIYIHRYTDKDASLFSLKKVQNKANERSSHLFNIFLLTITFFFICFFFNRQLQNVFDHSLWDFTSRKWVLSVEIHQAHTHIYAIWVQ